MSALLGLNQCDSFAAACEQRVGPVTLTDTLRQRKERLEGELKSVNDALEAITANPEIEKILNLISKARY